MPGMGTGCGLVRADVAARAMRTSIESALRDMPYRPYSWREARTGHGSGIFNWGDEFASY
jgi:hypothetical protein